MGSCVGNNSKPQGSQDRKSAVSTARYSRYQLTMLELMFHDVASRATKPGIIREHFDNFFHLNGLWSDQMFKTFDKNNQGYITYEQFLISIDIMVKGTFEEKTKVLFNFYDSDKSGGISFNQLIKMLFSYPKAQLNQMVTQQKFLESIDDYQKNFYFHPQKLILKDMNVVQQESEEEVRPKEQSQQDMQRIFSVHGPAIKTFMDAREMQEVDKQEQRKKQLLRLKNGENIHTRQSLRNIQIKQGLKKKISKHQQQHPQSIVAEKNNLNSKRKKYVIRSNIASLIRKYALFLFKQFGLDVKKAQMSFEHFKELVKNHQSIFNSYFQGFHSYIWQFDELKQIPEFRKHTPWIEGACKLIQEGQNSQRYLYFAKTTIFVLGNPKSNKPIQVINMQGLSIQESEHEGMFGFLIKHRDGIYAEKNCLFEKKQTRQEWMTYLTDFKDKSVYDCYTFLEKVGEGNFSSVYKGVSKQGNKQQVAIKVIKKFELSLNEKNVLKSECNILSLCHHPNIVKLYKIFQTRSHQYIVSQYLDEGDLFQYVKRNTFLEEYQAAFIMRQLVQVLKYFKSADLIHRDLKPQNVMVLLNKDKTMVQKIKIIDFGFAVYKNNLKNMDAKQKYAGTPGFLAPQIINCQDFDQSADIFSLGVILYFMLCGSLPFFSTFLEEIIAQTRQCNIVLKNVHWSNVSQQAKDLIYKMVTFKNDRIGLKQLAEHPWLHNIEDLKKYNKINKKNRYI